MAGIARHHTQQLASTRRAHSAGRLYRRDLRIRFGPLSRLRVRSRATGLHPADVDKLMAQLQGLVDAGNTVVVVEQDIRVVAASDWVIDIGPEAGEAGGKIVACGPSSEVSKAKKSRTAGYGV